MYWGSDLGVFDFYDHSVERTNEKGNADNKLCGIRCGDDCISYFCSGFNKLLVSLISVI